MVKNGQYYNLVILDLRIKLSNILWNTEPFLPHTHTKWLKNLSSVLYAM